MQGYSPGEIPTQGLVRLPVLLQLTGLSRATAYRYSKSDPSFPKPIKLSNSGARNASVAYQAEEIHRWIAERVRFSQAGAADAQ